MSGLPDREDELPEIIGQVVATYEKVSKINHLGARLLPSRESVMEIINGLKEMDQIAYIRFAIVYLRLDDLGALRKEIDSLLKG